MDPITCACWLTLSIASQHIDNSGLNTTNPGIGIEVNGWGVGEYDNSIHRTSWYFGKSLPIIEVGKVKAGFMVGGVTGYQKETTLVGSQTVYVMTPRGLQPYTESTYKTTGGTPGAISPMVAPFMSIEGKHVGANLIVMPDPSYWKQSAIGLQLKFRM